MANKITEDKARKQLELIRQSAADYEAAHGLEDELIRSFVLSVANGHYTDVDEAKRVALVIVKTAEIDFSRHTA